MESKHLQEQYEQLPAHRKVFTSKYWQPETLIPWPLNSPENSPHKALKASKDLFNNFVYLVYQGTTVPELLGRDAFNPNAFPEGTMIMYDRERLGSDEYFSRWEKPNSHLFIDYKNYPTVAANNIHCGPIDLLTQTNNKHSRLSENPSIRSGKAILTRTLKSEDDKLKFKEYEREVWFGVVIPKDRSRQENTVISFKQALHPSHKFKSQQLYWPFENSPLPFRIGHGNLMRNKDTLVRERVNYIYLIPGSQEWGMQNLHYRRDFIRSSIAKLGLK